MSADIDVGAITESLNNKVDLVNGVPQDAVDYVVAMQRPTAENNYTWYRKYKSGWVEQGGIIADASTYTLPIAMVDTNYYVNVCWDGGKSGSFYASDFQVRNLTTTSFYTTATRNGANIQGRCWRVSGISA